MTIRPKLKADVPDGLDFHEDAWSNTPVLASGLASTAKIGSNENTPQVPAWLASRHPAAQSGSAVNTNHRRSMADPKGAAHGDAGRDWFYDWEAALSGGATEEKRRRRFFLPRKAVGAQAGKGRLVARRLVVSAACLAIVAAVGGVVVLLSGHLDQQSVVAVTPVEKKEAPAVAGNAVIKPQQMQQTAGAVETKTPAGVNEMQKAAALPVKSAARRQAAKLPSSDSARWASNVVLPNKALSGALGAKSEPTARSMAAYAPVKDDAKSGPDMKPLPEAKTASLTPDQEADDSRTSSIPDDNGAAEKARGTMEDIARSRAKPIGTGGGSRASVTTAVNLRSGPDNHSHVLTVVPARASVELFSCSQWCKIAYGGHEGFVYKDFVRHSGHVPAVASRPGKTASKVASTESDNKLIGGAVVDDGSKATALSQSAAAPKSAQPTAATPLTMRHDSR